MYQLRKLAARHKGGVAAAGTIAVLLVSLAVTLVVQGQRVRRERDRAAAEAAKATAINEFLKDAFGAADPWRKGSRNVPLLDALRLAGAKAGTSLRTQPLVQASVLETIGATLSNLIETDEALKNLRAAYDLRVAAAGKRSGEAAESLVALSNAETYAKKFAEAEGHAKEAYEIVREQYGPKSLETAPAANALASAIAGAGRRQEAKALADDLRALGRAHRDAPTKEERDAAAKAESDALLVLILIHTTGDEGDAKELVPLAEERLALLKARYGDRHPEVANATNDLALGLMYAGDLEGAERRYLEAIDMDVALLGEDHPEVATLWENLGGAYLRMKKFDKTAALLEKVLASRRKALGDDSEPVARTLTNFATVQRMAGNYAAAEKAYPEAIARLTKKLGPEHPDVGIALLGYGDTLRIEKKYAEAEAPLRRAVELLSKANGDTAGITQRTLGAVVKLYTEWGKPDRAAAYQARIQETPKAP